MIWPMEKSSLLSPDCETRIRSFRQISHWITRLYCSVTRITLMARDLQWFLLETSVNHRPLSPNISMMGLTKAFLLENWEDLTSGNRVVNNMWQQTWSEQRWWNHTQTERAKKKGEEKKQNKNKPLELKIAIVKNHVGQRVGHVVSTSRLNSHWLLCFDRSKQAITLLIA